MLLAKRIGLMFIRTIHKFYYLYYKQRIALQIVYGYVFFLQFLMRTQSFAFRFFSLLLIINCCQFVTIVHECMLNAVHTEFKHYYNDTRWCIRMFIQHFFHFFIFSVAFFRSLCCFEAILTFSFIFIFDKSKNIQFYFYFVVWNVFLCVFFNIWLWSFIDIYLNPLWKREPQFIINAEKPQNHCHIYLTAFHSDVSM